MKKIDKDALMKQKFWILLGVFALLWIVCLSFIAVNAGGPVKEAKDSYNAAKDAVAKYPTPKNESFLPPWRKYGATFTKHKNEVWKIAWVGDPVKEGETLPAGQKRWEGQGGMYDWPHDQEHPLDTVLLYPYSPFEVRLREWYKTKDAYGQQFTAVQQALQGTPPPTGQPPASPLGAVTFKGGFDGVMKPVDFEATTTHTPDAEECWLAQEDFWVKRELLYVVQNALAMAARLDPVAEAKAKDTEDAPAKDAKDKEAPPAKDAKYLGEQVFRNASWEVTLRFDKDDKGQTRISPDSRIKNVHVSHREQELGNSTIRGVFFRLIQRETRKTFSFEGSKVPWDKDAPLGNDKGLPMPSVHPSEPMELEQVFDRSNTPIASIDEIRIPYLSNRNANRPLVAAKPKRFGKEEAPPADATKVAATPGAGAMGMPAGAPGVSPMSGSGGGPMYGMQPGGVGAAGGLGGAQGSANKTPNLGLDRDRYLFVTDQSRHLPLAMTLAVDQSHLNEILVALANSRLRFQTTQVEFRRQPAGASANSATGGGFPQPGYGGSGSPGALTPGTPMRTPAVPPSGFEQTSPSGTASTATATTPGPDNPNLVELTIYGIASLYERPSEKAAEEKK
jgi:hypothetical protein